MRCAADVAPVRAAPTARSEQVTQALLGEALQLLERHGAWGRVLTAYDYEGWIALASLEDGEGAFPAPDSRLPLEAARRYLGSPYLWGGMTTRGIDCSGLVHMAYRHAGQQIPRDSWQQERAGLPIDESDALAGDLISYGTGAKADHIAFFLDSGRILHATARDGLGVVEQVEPEALRASRRRIFRLEDTERPDDPDFPHIQRLERPLQMGDFI
jgi:cell wall-associated NlpC family hydrolase